MGPSSSEPPELHVLPSWERQPSRYSNHGGGGSGKAAEAGALGLQGEGSFIEEQPRKPIRREVIVQKHPDETFGMCMSGCGCGCLCACVCKTSRVYRNACVRNGWEDILSVGFERGWDHLGAQSHPRAHPHTIHVRVDRGACVSMDGRTGIRRSGSARS